MQWGEITVECDVKTCQTVQHFNSIDLKDVGLREAKRDAGWRWFKGKDICPFCEEERRATQG